MEIEVRAVGSIQIAQMYIVRLVVLDV